MILKLDMSSEIPIFIQIRDQIVTGIGNGELEHNERLPSIRMLADEIGVNMMTVSKAYTLLKNEGYIDMVRRQGAVVNGKLNPASDFYKKLTGEISLLAAEAKVHGIKKEEFLDICNKLYDNKEVIL